MDRLQRLFQGAGGASGGVGDGPSADATQVDTSEQIYISSLALLKMLKHGEFIYLPSTVRRRQHVLKLPMQLRGGQDQNSAARGCWAQNQFHCNNSSLVGRAGVPMEVMGLMLGEFVDDYTVRVADVFAMPQSGTGVSVEAVDPVFQTKMLDMLKQVGRCGN